MLPKIYGFLYETLSGITSRSVWVLTRYYFQVIELTWWLIKAKNEKIFIDATDMIDFNMAQLKDEMGDRAFFRLSRTDPSVGFSFGLSVLPGHTYPPSTSAYDFSSLLHRRLFLASHLASFIRAQILTSFNHTCSAGISTSKLTAKLAGSVNKPDKQTLLLPGFEAEFLAGHEVGKVPGIGYKAAQKIRNAVLGKPLDTVVKEEFEFWEVSEKVTVGDARACLTPEGLETMIGGNSGLGRKMWGWLYGIDNSRIEAAPIIPTQISIEDTFRPGKLTNLTELAHILKQLTLKLLQRMHTELIGPGGEKWLAHPRNFRLSVRFHQKNLNFSRVSKSAIMPRYIFSLTTAIESNAERLVKDVALGLFKKLCRDKRWELQLLNVAAVNMVDGNSGGDIREIFTSRKVDWQEKENKKREKYGNNGPENHSEEEGEEGEEEEEKEEEEEEGEEDWNDGFMPDGDGGGGRGPVGFEDNDPCLLCGARFPIFALEAHKRFHDMGEV